ncbi:hypothetical protein TTHERM_00647030 (macronuclear) [Tetrahymena thermophila SB210]|uniref:Uncharacterized protein n=1 Tax=Tetrahymena thermophila (strain SB210) TaxID=312017 RepID=I7MB23_TETTS|nr:hypothetical protein TTHERM_00647030 [Tetrahymena thermophila SB210]EAS07170.1 hypothetical protein TTHERM_00647030 [Tetrahymena thermophila SB210]|eukprot:XP_001027412.1 hypothetical protein TTHERM_00647030 [Tetrahymena thermophila SB210]
MNSLLNRPQTQKTQIEQFSNFQEGINALFTSTSSLDSSRISNNFDKDYWINYYTQQKIKVKEEKQKIQFLSDKKQPTNILNGKRQLIFSRPYKSKVINKKQVNMKLDSSQLDLGERVLDCLKQQENSQVVQQEAEQLENIQANESQNNQVGKGEQLISPCLSQNNLQSMISQKNDQEFSKQQQQQQQQLIQLQLQQIQQYNMLLQNSTQFQTPQSSGQTSPIQSVSTLAYKQSQNKLQQKQLECIGISSQRQISSNTNNSFQSMVQINNVQPFQSVNDINQRKSSIFRDDSNQNSNQPSKNQLELQCIHVKKLKGIGEKIEKEIAKNLFSNNHLILATSPTNQQHMSQTQNQFTKTATQKVYQSQNSQALINNFSIMQNNKVLEKSIINFQKQKALSTIKYNSFLQDLNSGSLKSSIHQSGEQNKQLLGVQSQQELQYCKLKTESALFNGRGSMTPTTMKQDPNEIIFTSQNNYQDSFLENKDQSQKLFLLEGYSQTTNQAQKIQQFPQNNSEDIQVQLQQSSLQYQQAMQPLQQFQQLQQQYLFPKSQAGNQAQFFQELNKQRILSSNNNNVVQNLSNISSVLINNQQQQNATSKKRLASANQYNRKLMSNYKKQELLVTTIKPEFINSQLEEQSNIKNSIHIKTQISNNSMINSKNNKNKNITINNTNNEINQNQQLNQSKKIPGFNVLEGIQQLSIKQQLQGSQSTTNATSTSSQINNNITNKQFKLTNFTSPKTQKSFQVLYKICNKNILNTGLKEQKSTFIKLI